MCGFAERVERWFAVLLKVALALALLGVLVAVAYSVASGKEPTVTTGVIVAGVIVAIFDLLHLLPPDP